MKITHKIVSSLNKMSTSTCDHAFCMIPMYQSPSLYEATEVTIDFSFLHRVSVGSPDITTHYSHGSPLHIVTGLVEMSRFSCRYWVHVRLEGHGYSLCELIIWKTHKVIPISTSREIAFCSFGGKCGYSACINHLASGT
jgi:hypothetical protein